MQLLHTQSQLIAHVQSILNESLNAGDYDSAIALSELLKNLTTGYESLNKNQTASPTGTVPAGRRGLRPPMQQMQQMQQQMRPSIQPRYQHQQQRQAPPQPQSYVYADGFQGVELPLETDRGHGDNDELPTPDYWDSTQG